MSDQHKRRLKNDYERLIRELEGNHFVSIDDTKGDPPHQYIIVYHLKGVMFDASAGQISHIKRHEVQITLFTEYPTAPPQCRMRTEIFHPNMNLSEISLGEERGWSASQPLIDIVKRIGRMISYQEYSLNAPLNKEAAKWAKKNASALPLNSADFFAPDETTPEASKALEGAAGEKAFCAYCQDVDPKNICDSGHAVCGDCLSHCRYCDHATCLACSGNTCRTCAQQISADRSEIAAAFERGDIGQVDALVSNALKRFPDSLELMESLDKAKRVKRTLSHMKGFKKAKCFHAIVTAHEELRSMGFDHEILSEVTKKAAERLNAANAAVEKGKNELQTNRCPKRASQYFSHALRIVSDHPSAYKLLQEAKTRMVKAHGKMESAKQWFDKDQHDAAIREATKALALDSTLRPEAQELIETASHLQTSQTRKKHKRLLLVCMTLATVLIAAVVSWYVSQDRQHKAAYHMFLAQLEKEATPEDKIEALVDYIGSHKRTRCTRDAERRLDHLNALIQEREFEIAKRNAGIMLAKQDYEKAQTIYQQYLSRNPDTAFATELHGNISNLRNMMDDQDYETLQWLVRCNPKTRVGAYKSYLSKHPQGKYRDEVEEILRNTSGDYYKGFQAEIASLKENQRWDQCIQACDDFDETLKESEWAGQIDEVRSECRRKNQEEGDLTALIVEANAKGEEYELAKQVYLVYLEAHPDSSVRDRIEEQVEALDQKMRNAKQWQNVKAYVTYQENDLDKRIRKLEEYVEGNATENHLEEARHVLQQLKAERDTRSWKEVIAQCSTPRTSIEKKTRLLETFIRGNVSGKYLNDAKAKLAALETERGRKSWEDMARYCSDHSVSISDRINRLMLYIEKNQGGEFIDDARWTLAKLRRFSMEEQRIRDRLRESGNIYVYGNGTITDLRTGLMWCAFDSYLDLQKCLSYESAIRYVRGVGHGGYSDWCIPSEAALRSIYKKKPFFPTATEGEWYWTSSNGGGSTVPIVTTERTTAWQMAQIEAYVGCGSVRAVRMP
ncbi:MAG: DUF1566 domain-containing protein [Deltaproteobacteria bacterium]|jgi:ubiquitin-protein ligase